jgi:sulfide:quinone oxidoreductase
LIAGGGVAALEALIALRALAHDAVAIELLSPGTDFSYRPMSVAEPFGLARVMRYDLGQIAAEFEATHRTDGLASVDPEGHAVLTTGGQRLEYDALLITIGAKYLEALPGALTFRGQVDREAMSGLLGDLERGEVGRLVFAVPPAVRWPLALYELALMTSGHLTARGVREVAMRLVTHEAEPLGLFGAQSSNQIRELMSAAGVELQTGTVSERVEPGRLILQGGDGIDADRVVALARLEVAPIPGIPQTTRGFIPTDPYGRVDDLRDVYAAGDATWYPLKQGGLATQQADAAASAIARQAGAEVELEPFRPILRGVLLTGTEPLHMRAEVGGHEHGPDSSTDALWWPPSKVAGRFLSPYLASKAGPEEPEHAAFQDSWAPDGAPPGPDQHAAIQLALAAAEESARWSDFDSALRWLGVAERLNMVLPDEYLAKRREWSAARRGAAPG